MKKYWQYWIIAGLVLYIVFFSRKKCKNESFYDIDWDQLGTAHRSFGRTAHIAELNDAVWNPDCLPQGEYYAMRYSQPSQFMHQHKTQKPLTLGYYNACAEKIH